MPKQLSTSRIGMHCEIVSPALTNWLEGLAVWPQSAVVFETGLAEWLRVRSPAIAIYLRWVGWDSRAGELLRMGVQGGIDFANAMPKTSSANYYLGLNEPTGIEPQSVIDAVNFYIGFANRCKQLGIKPAGLQIAVGNPDLSQVVIMKPAIEAILAAGGVVTYHSYGPANLLYAKEWLALRAVAWRTVLGPIPLAFTEALWDTCTDSMPSGAWRDLLRDGHLTLSQMHDQLELYNRALIDNKVRCAVAYTVGGLAEWARYDFLLNNDALRILADHWAVHVNEVLPSPDPIPVPPVTTLVVSVDSAYFRFTAQGTPTANIIGKLKRGTQCKVLGKSGEWWRVEVPIVGGVGSYAQGYVHQSVVS